MAIGLLVLLVLLIAAVWMPLPHDPEDPNFDAILAGPGSDYYFGTDGTGLDVFSRTIASAQRDVPLALGGTFLSLLLGVPLGLLASMKGAWGERMMRGLDIFQAFPILVLAIVLVSVTGNELRNVVIAIAIINVPRFMRLIRSEALTLRESRFVEAAFAIGCSKTRVMLRHVLPNVTGVTLAQSALAAAHAIIVIAALSFLGVGVSLPEPSWGLMIQSGARNITTGQWWVALFPGIAVFIAVLSLNLIADGLQDVFERTEKAT
jgi:peptide/nickel transport system permease protein